MGRPASALAAWFAATANVTFNAQADAYEYMVAFLSPGDYTVAFTSYGQNDVIPGPENPALVTDNNATVSFTAGQNVTVVDEQTTTVDF